MSHCLDLVEYSQQMDLDMKKNELTVLGQVAADMKENVVTWTG